MSAIEALHFRIVMIFASDRHTTRERCLKQEGWDETHIWDERRNTQGVQIAVSVSLGARIHLAAEMAMAKRNTTITNRLMTLALPQSCTIL